MIFKSALIRGQSAALLPLLPVLKVLKVRVRDTRIHSILQYSVDAVTANPKPAILPQDLSTGTVHGACLGSCLA